MIVETVMIFKPKQTNHKTPDSNKTTNHSKKLFSMIVKSKQKE